MASWSIFNELDSLRREIDEAFRGVGLSRPLTTTFLSPYSTKRFPLLNLTEDEDKVYIEALLPGVDPKELELSVLRGTLTISGERKAPTEKGVLHRTELGFGRFTRSIDLPADINPDNTKAEYKDGVMLITMTKSEHAKPRKIEIAS
ncbi:Hsp20/alpha crystallin family protein [Geomonas sp. Red32]|uniref:Hsp20/alpha crystallin family protein n=1 Tax=Geomonas sp. Red32 TaxID=2912856 RepID=UPI00202CA965|nr:Hsp20/alpha crystallin family protein [Geomonas sp. Red32]MCM0083781.1 Hsp20/alpha crystallin family protein [Geomonas sp. Red32]